MTVATFSSSKITGTRISKGSATLTSGVGRSYVRSVPRQHRELSEGSPQAQESFGGDCRKARYMKRHMKTGFIHIGTNSLTSPLQALACHAVFKTSML